MNKQIDVALCADRNIRIGLHVTVCSMLTNLSDGVDVRLHILSDSMTDQDFADLEETISRTKRSVTLYRHDVSTNRFRKYKWLTGWMTYVRILIPDIVDATRVLYMDSDLIVGCDVSSLFHLDLEGHALGAVSRQTIGETNDRDFFRDQQIDLDRDYFNAGLLLIDVDHWRRRSLVSVCLQAADRFGKALPSADQTVLNYVLVEHGFMKLPPKFNLPINPDREQVPAESVADRVVHLIGFPKPWSFMGEFFNQQSHLYKAVLEKTAYAGYKSYHSVSISSVLLVLRKARAYAKSGRHLIKNHLH